LNLQATVAATIVAVAKARAHHVWLKDEGRHLKGIVTLSDLVRIAMKVN
jgi:CBS-domain-containing membrane protein